MLQRLVIFCAALAALLWLADGAGHATTPVKKDLERLCREAETIVIAKVIGQRIAPAVEGGIAYTHTTLAVEETLEGKARKTIVVSEPGGRLGNVTCVVPGMPQYRAGERVLLVLETDALGLTRTLGLTQGKFRIKKNRATGDDVVLPNPGLGYVTKKHFPKHLVAPSGTIDLEDFVERVKTYASLPPPAKKKAKEAR